MFPTGTHLQGLVSEGLRTAEGVYRTVYDRCGLGFETPEALYADGKHYRAIGYMRPLAAWTVLQAVRNSSRGRSRRKAEDQ